jgi:uncharacterized protein (DUF58 family)
MTRRPSPRLQAYLVLGAGGLFASAALGRPEPVILVAPLLLAALLGLLLVEDPAPSLEVSLDADRILEGQGVRLEVRLRSALPIHWLELAVALPPGLNVRDGTRVQGLQLDRGVERQVELDLSARRWGSYRVGDVVLRIRDRFGFFAFEGAVETELALRVFPQPETLRHVIRPAATRAHSGNEVSRRPGDGIEFAGVRPYAPGDQIRRVNWRLSSRRPDLHVNELHRESSTDVVILVDTFSDIGDAEDSSLGAAVRGANGIADHYLRRRDRVGLIAFGRAIRWLVPSMGLGQSYRILESLLDARAAFSLVWKGADLIPPRSLPSKALVIALSPLMDDRTIEALLDLRGRGFDMVVIEIRPEAYIAAPTDAFGATARRIWHLQRELLRDRFRRVGVPIASWSAGEPLDASLEEARSFRRRRALA